jgi:hypothetical protein
MNGKVVVVTTLVGMAILALFLPAAGTGRDRACTGRRSHLCWAQLG